MVKARWELIPHGADIGIRASEIPRSEHFRSDLGLMYFADMNPVTGKLLALRMTPTQIRRFRLNRPSAIDAQWLADLLDREGQRFNTRVLKHADDTLTLSWD